MHHGVIFNFCSAKVCSPAILETSFSYDKDVWIAATDYYMHFYIIMLFPLRAILQLISFTAYSWLHKLLALCSGLTFVTNLSSLCNIL